MQSRFTASTIWLRALFIALVTCSVAQADEESRQRTSEASSPTRPGETAPEWHVVEWSDGQDRSLSAFRGKIVVLDFWGTWCGPCLQVVPILKELEQHYAQKGVVFLAIHTAGTEMKTVKDVLRREKWSIPTGLDHGKRIADGTTVCRFGIIGYPTLVVIGHDGVIVYNSSADMMPARKEGTLKEYKEIALSLGIPWPIAFEGDRDPEEVKRHLRRLAKSLYERKIDTAIAARSHPRSPTDSSEADSRNAEPAHVTEPATGSVPDKTSSPPTR